MDVKTLANSGKPDPPPARGSQRARAVEFDGASGPTSMPNSTTSVQYGFSPISQNPTARKMIVPQFPPPPTQAITDDARDPLYALKRSTASITTQSPPTLPSRPAQPGSFEATQAPKLPSNKPEVLRKPAPPPIPTKKPSLLSKAISPNPTGGPSTSSLTLSRQNSDYSALQEERKPEPPPPRRSMATPPNLTARKPIQSMMQGEDKPPLPPRTNSNEVGPRPIKGSKSLMDDEPEELSSLKDWEVLKPVQ